MPASASPSATVLTTALTSVSWLAGTTRTPAFCNAWVAYRPHGTAGPHRTTTRPGRTRSASPVMPFGFPAATTICSRLVANTRGDPITSPPSTSFCMLGWSAEANTSTGAPGWTWATRVGEPAKVYSARRCGCTWPAADPMDWNAAVSEAAAKTLTGLGAAGDDDTGPGLPHAAATRPTAATRLLRRIWMNAVIPPCPGARPRHW